MITIGVNYIGPGHDASAALAIDGRIVYAIAEERLTRAKQDGSFPVQAINACLAFAKVSMHDIDELVVGWPPLKDYHAANVKLIAQRKLAKSIPVELLGFYRGSTTRSMNSCLRAAGLSPRKLTHINHHLAHALSVLPYLQQQRSLIFIIDGRGISESTSVYLKDGIALRLLKTIDFPNSLGLFYSEITAICGFRKNSDEWKVMGLAPYGQHLLNLEEFISEKKGSYQVNHKKLMDTNELVIDKVRIRKRTSDKESINDNVIKDLALSAQYYYEQTLLAMVKHYSDEYNVKSVGIAGGGGLNCKANGFLFRELKLEEIFIQPAATDDGTALGAALYPSYSNQTIVQEKFNPYLGNEYSNEEVQKTLDKYNLTYQYIENIEADAAAAIAGGQIIGWFQGRDEFGPRALGNRSIISDPRRADMKDRVNEIVKYRENWRPFAPSLLEEHAGDILRNVSCSPYMILCDYVSEEYERKIPAVVHVDKTMRPQTVGRDLNQRYWNLINEFYKLTGVAVVMNTSYNLKGEPNVSCPTDAIRTFYSSGLNVLYMGNYKILK